MKLADALACFFGGVRTVFVSVITKPRVFREAAFAVDVAISLTLAIFPGVFGWVACVSYFLLRDVLTASRQSLGKGLYGLVVVRESDGRQISWQMSIVRSLLMLAPPVNLVDIFYFVRDGRRLTDQWLGFDVVYDKVDDKPQNEDDGENPPNEE